MFLGEAEESLLPFLEELLGSGEGIGRVRVGARPKAAGFLRPDFSWIRPGDYSAMGLQFSRGCPHDCEFCDITVRFGRAMRTKEVADFLAEFDLLFARGWRGPVFIIDDNFIGRPKSAAALLKALATWQKERDYPFELFTQATVLLGEERNEPLLRAFYPAGFSMVFLGIETPNEASLVETGKRHNVRGSLSLAEKIRRIQAVGQLFVMGGFIVGFDNDTPDIFDRQERFNVEETGLPVAMVGILDPLPHTQLEARLRREGRLLRSSQGTISGGSDVIFEPKHLSPQELQDGYLRLMRRLYSDTGRYYDRCFTSLALAGRPQFKDTLSRDLFVAIYRLLLYEGVLSRHRLPFWRYLMKVVVHHPSKLPYAFRWAGYGLHYRVLTERMQRASSQPRVPPMTAERLASGSAC